MYRLALPILVLAVTSGPVLAEAAAGRLAMFNSWVECVKTSAQSNYPAKRASDAVLLAFDACSAQEDALKSTLPEDTRPIKGRNGQPMGEMNSTMAFEALRMELASLMVMALQHPEQDLFSHFLPYK